PVFYIIDDAKKWNNISELKKASPNLNVSVTEKYIKEEITIAKSSLSKRAEFLMKYCNLKQNNCTAWLSYQDIEKICGGRYELADFKNCYCVGGIDLSQTTDLTACSIIIEKNEKLFIFCKFFMPRNRIQTMQSTEGVPYEIFVKRGIIVESGENFVNYKDCYDWFVELVEKYKIYPLKIGYDRYSSQYLVNDLQNRGFQMDDVYQGENLSPVIKEFEGILKDKNLQIGENDLLKSHFLNVALKENLETRKNKPVKINQRSHIDGFVSVIDALTVRQKWYSEIGIKLKNEVTTN
ncbi:MAG: terminase TerL endonuclease subunit, partial [Oscillospiraceae bacterium]